MEGNRIKLRSFAIVKPELDAQQFMKHSIVIILDNQTSDIEKKSLKNISKKYQTTFETEWKSSIFSKTSRQSHPNPSLYIVLESYSKQITRELKMNPSLRVILYSRKQAIEQWQDSNVCFVSSCMADIEQYLHDQRKRLILSR